jgi:hypothetical protein
MRYFNKKMSKKRGIQSGILKILEKYLFLIFENRTECAADLNYNLASRFFSAAKKDYFT